MKIICPLCRHDPRDLHPGCHCKCHAGGIASKVFVDKVRKRDPNESDRKKLMKLLRRKK